jgi:phosphatidylglycerophosphate synthase
MPVVNWLASAGVQPNHVTIAGLIASLLAGLSLAFGHLLQGLIWLIVSLLCDLLDGDLARLKPGHATRLGAFFDSCADRVSEALVLGGLLIGKCYHAGGASWAWLAVWVLAFSGSFMVSYTRARAEGLGISCSVGFAERPERMAFLLLLLIFGFGASGWFLLALTLLTWWTVYQRTIHSARKLGEAERDRGEHS